MLIRSIMENFSFHRGEPFVPPWGTFRSTKVERKNVSDAPS
ncbi:hypothetical protein [Bacteroides sp. AM10-21B]|nr:hypothetical protein [Bacteroides sp. AM10-21B]